MRRLRHDNFWMKGMRRVVLLLALSLAAVALRAQEAPAEGPRLVFDRETHHFGRIPGRGGKVSCEFPFTNRGTAPLVITRIVTSCTCTKGSFPKRPVAPGGTGTVTITYDPAQQQGVFFKAIQVYSNDGRKRVIVTVKGEVY